jgi:hypothetical protein
MTNAHFHMRSHFSNETNTQFPPGEDYPSASVLPHNGLLYVDARISETHLNTPEENHNLVELLEAATTAASQSTDDMSSGSKATNRINSKKGKRKRMWSSPTRVTDNSASPNNDGDIFSDHKSTKLDIAIESSLRDVDSGSQTPSDAQISQEAVLVDRTVRGHSAAALFRPSSERGGRKHTRPPMSKLFMSLQLTPESFLRLQAKAKLYMLDLEHPERQNCVGNRGKGDSDMVKLRLFNCVRIFLSNGVGEEFWGEDIERPGQEDVNEAARVLGQGCSPVGRKLVWPRDVNLIISLVTPLLRRMVTNERQHIYAIETRKGGRKKDNDADLAGSCDISVGADQTNSQTLPSRPTLDPSSRVTMALSSHISSTRLTSPDLASHPVPEPLIDAGFSNMKTEDLPIIQEYVLNSIRIHLSVDGKRLKPSKELANNVECPWAYILAEIRLLVQSAVNIYPELR